MSKIKHAINTKSIRVSDFLTLQNERSNESKVVAIKEASNYYLSRYFCVCDLGIPLPQKETRKQSVEERAKKFLTSSSF